MKILFVGDVVGKPGRKALNLLDRVIEREAIDFTVVNVENAAGGFGVTAEIFAELSKLPVDVFTSGNHIWDKREIYDFLGREDRLLRPANYADSLPGRGLYVGKARNGVAYAVMNLQGRVYMPSTDCPFRKADELLGSLPDGVNVRFVDFHAEVTSEKMAMGWHLDGRVTAVVGTHTHIPTSDTRLLEKGTAYQTDAGMTGPYNSIIGVEKEAVLHKFKTSLPVRFESARKWVELRGVVVECDELTGRATAVRPLIVAER
ncbi:TIGR00282 family metallophosphoesterase [Acidobacteria bacterium ACD]|nr:TIGR00282 family metallophosphoesterase [Acidobacteria bacterium ACD]